MDAGNFVLTKLKDFGKCLHNSGYQGLGEIDLLPKVPENSVHHQQRANGVREPCLCGRKIG
jgi:hypothetical protein